MVFIWFDLFYTDCFVCSINHFLTGWNVSIPNQKLPVQDFVMLTLRANWWHHVKEYEKLQENCVVSHVLFCLKPLVPLERCERFNYCLQSVIKNWSSICVSPLTLVASNTAWTWMSVTFSPCMVSRTPQRTTWSASCSRLAITWNHALSAQLVNRNFNSSSSQKDPFT